MNKSKDKIDFVVDQAFADTLAEPGEPEILKGEKFLLFYPLYHLYLLYVIIDQIHDKEKCPEESALKKMGLNSSAIYSLSQRFTEELPVYRFIHSIMFNRIGEVKAALDQNVIKLRSSLEHVSLFEHAGKAPIVYGFSYLNLAAALGRTEMVRLFIEKKVNPGEMVFYDTVKSIPIALSVNECLIMNAIYCWYKAGKKQRLTSQKAENLIDTITLLSKVAPSIVSDDHLLEQGVRTTWYWGQLKTIVANAELLKKLIPLNPRAMKENLGIPE